jgi:hypothetical protein
MLVEETKDRGDCDVLQGRIPCGDDTKHNGQAGRSLCQDLENSRSCLLVRKDALTAILLVPVTIHAAKLPIHATGQREHSASCGSDITIPMLHSRAEHVIPKGRHFARTQMSHYHPPRTFDIVWVVAHCIFSSPSGHL